MSELQERVEKAIIETLTNQEDGAGSDLYYCTPALGGDWLHLEGYLDVAHLASDVIRAITGEWACQHSRGDHARACGH